MKNFRRFLIFLVIAVLLGGGIYFGLQYKNQLEINEGLYTQEEVEQKYQEYIDQISDKNVVIDELNGQVAVLVEENEQHEATISSLQNSISEKDSQIETLTSEKATLTGQIETLNSQISELNFQIEGLSEDKENNLAQIEELQSEKSALETQVATLTASVGEKEQTIQTLTADKAELEEEVLSLSETVSQNETTISGLNSQVLNLQNEITRLEGLLEAYEDYVNQSVTLTYYVDNVLFDTQVITRGETTSQAKTPEDTDKYSFVKWQIDGEDFDFSTYTFTLNTRIDAVVNYNIYDVTFMYDSEEYYSCDVYGGEYVTGFSAPIVDNSAYEFKGVTLSLEDIEYIDLSTYKILSNVTFYVVVECLYPSIQTYNSDDLETAYSVASVSDFEKLATLTNSGNTFEGITIYQIEDVNFSGVSNWTPIGNRNNPFKGNFNGLSHSIINFSYSGDLSNIAYSYKPSSTTLYFAEFGLFGFIGSPSTSLENYLSFENVKFSNSNIFVSRGTLNTSYTRYVGVLCGYSNCVNFDNVVFESGTMTGFNVSGYKCYMGDLMGDVTNTKEVKNCVSYIDFINVSHVTLLSGKVQAHDCTSYSDVTNANYLYNLRPEYTSSDDVLMSYNNKSYGVYTSVNNIYGFPSYEEVV